MEKQNRGFRLMSAERLAEIASLGGKAAHTQGKAYHWDSEKAKEAGRKGGLALAEKKRQAKLFAEKANEGFAMAEDIKERV